MSTSAPVEVTVAGDGGLGLAADRTGDPGAPPVVLLHGGGQTRHSWRGTAAALAAAGWAAWTVDLRGHGDSAWPDDGDYRAEAFAADVAAVARSLRSPPVLVGASLGGIASLLAVGQGPPGLARGLVLVDIAVRSEAQGRERIGRFMLDRAVDGFASLEEAADAVAAYNPARPRPSDLSGLQKNLRRRPDGRWRWHWDPRFVLGQGGVADETRTSMMPTELLERSARSLTVPVLLVRGARSDLLSEAGAAEMLALVPHASYVNVDGAGHMIAGDRNDAFNSAVASWVAQLDPPETGAVAE